MASSPTDRRRFLQGLVVTVVASSGLYACGDDTTGEEDNTSYDPADQARVYPQGIASGDPAPDSVILWTRVVPTDLASTVKVRFEVAETNDFERLIATGEVDAAPEYDHTVRVKATGLLAYKVYYYRFKAEGVGTITGRTKTAPAPDQDVNPRFAFASCQDFIGRYYHAYQVLADEPEPVDFVLHLGDYIYETNGDPDFQQVAPERAITINDGIQLLEDNPAVKAASSLADYRGLYKQYRSDPNLQRMHALAPFVCIWDDHEFANDCWQDHATDFNDLKGDEKSPERRHAASQAWFEFQPTDLAFDAAAAPPADIKIYRSFRYGKHLEIFLTDQRSYRSDHVIPEGAEGSEKPAGAPAEVPTYSEVGKVFTNSEIFSRNFVKKAGFDLIEAYVKPTMLGAEQKAWLVGAMQASTATWKVWGNETQLAQMMLDLTSFAIPDAFKAVYYFTVDQWDGFRSERAEVLQALTGVRNLVALTGDIHAFYACEIHADPDDLSGSPMAVEFVTGGISSSSTQEITQTQVDANPAFVALGPLVPMFDQVLLGASLEYKFANSNGYGASIVSINGDTDLTTTFLQLSDVKSAVFSGAVDRKSFRTQSGVSRVVPV